MASFNGNTGVDMNDPTTLAFYSQILLFKNDTSKEDLRFNNNSSEEQRLLQSLAHKLDLEYEYTISSQTVRICRPCAVFNDPPTIRTRTLEPNNNFNDCTSEGDFNLFGIGQFETGPNDLASLGNLDEFASDSSTFESATDTTFRQHLRRNPSRPSIFACMSDPVLDTSEASMLPFPELSSSSFTEAETGHPFESDNALFGVPSTSDVKYPENPADAVNVSSGLGLDGLMSYDSSACQLVSPSCASNNLIQRPNDDFQNYSMEQQNVESGSSPNVFTEKNRVRGRLGRLQKRSKSKISSNSTSSRCEVPEYKGKFATRPTIFKHQGHKFSKHSSNVSVTTELYSDLFSDLPNTSESDFSSLESPLPFQENLSWMNGNPTDSQAFDSQSTTSRSTSISSARSNEDYVSSGRLSTESARSSDYREINFDSNSARSEGLASTNSRRRGPLSEIARASMMAVKRVGACWRCRFLKKTCDPQEPCALCPKGSKSKWGLVGCKRGAFQAEFPLNKLCRWQRVSKFVGNSSISQDEEMKCASTMTKDLEEILHVRAAWISQISLSSGQFGVSPLDEESNRIRDLFQRQITNSTYWINTNIGSSILNPLNECILAVVWEVLHTPTSRSMLGKEADVESLAQLLPSAAVYQAKLDSNQLIAQSLICLRTCLELLRVKSSGFLDHCSHRNCVSWSHDEASYCNVECINTLNMHLKLYFDELSRVFFKKQNVGDKAAWWLSTFYSFCIQSFVRRALIQLTENITYDAASQGLTQSKQYLHIPLRLFIASSGAYDPLDHSMSTFDPRQYGKDDRTPRPEDIHEARSAVRQAGWCLIGVSNSADYLKKLFEDDGSVLETGFE